jgi:glycyl-tRNA synthetase (class II)
MEDGTVTLRDRDSLAQERVPAGELGELLTTKLASDWTSPKLG